MNDLRKAYPRHSVECLCRLFGRSKQAYFKSLKKITRCTLEEGLIVEKVAEIRREMPRLGGRKLHKILCDELPQELTIGRDSLYALLRREGYLLRMRKYKPLTTDSRHRFQTYPNLVKGVVADGAHQVYVSDITYIPMKDKTFRYLSLITDAHSRKIVGWCLFDSLQTDGPLIALRMALEGLPPQHRLIHHSDRGTQYCSYKYTEVLRKRNIRISMTQSGDPLDNAIAERVNGILKMEWLNDMQFSGTEQARRSIARVIDLYNNRRPHSSIDMMTPLEASSKKGVIRRKWKNYYSKRTMGTTSMGTF